MTRLFEGRQINKNQLVNQIYLRSMNMYSWNIVIERMQIEN